MSPLMRLLRPLRVSTAFVLALLLWCAAPAVAQPRNQWPSGYTPRWNDTAPVFNAPPNLGNATLGAPNFDPFATGGAPPAPTPQPWPGPSATNGLLNGTPPYPSQSNNAALFPNGLFGSSTTPQPAATSGLGLQGPVTRFLQAPRIRHTWLHGDGGDDLQINDTDLSLVFAWPNYLGTGQPLFVVPSFSLHLWDGPDNRPLGNDADLPGSAYSAFLDAGWESSPEATLGGEVGARVGVFTDFTTFTSDSLRIQGKGLGRLRLTETVQIRGGVYYVDRLRIKLLPVGGVLWTPNPQTRFDIYFPNPKLSQYMTTIGNNELWWYIAGEYGGGSWTVKRTVNNRTEQVDLNDVRLMMGIEWGGSHFFRRGRRVGFFEAGWVTDREILYRNRPQDNLRLDDTLMIRAGFGY